VSWIPHARWSRSRFLRACLVVPATYVLAACTGEEDGDGTAGTSARAQATGTAPPSASAPATESARTATAQPTVTQALAPTPACSDDDDPTPAQTEGPYFTPNSPERASLLEPGLAGTRLVLTGHVLTTDCRPIAGALLDFWQADAAGAYDNAGFRLRGHQFTDAAGRYRLETVVPGLYPGRTRHIHVKAQAPNQPILTTQLYFPGESRNSADRIFHSALVMDAQQNGGNTAATFNFVLNLR
jgi:protocatechuate 3,4-dioxygenase beta subunit